MSFPLEPERLIKGECFVFCPVVSRRLRERRVSTDLCSQKPQTFPGREGRRPCWICASLLPRRLRTPPCEFTRRRTEETRRTSSRRLFNVSVSSPDRDVAASVKTRPKSPNSCLDAQRRLADDNRTSVKGPAEPNPPMPVRLRQRAAATRCE